MSITRKRGLVMFPTANKGLDGITHPLNREPVVDHLEPPEKPAFVTPKYVCLSSISLKTGYIVPIEKLEDEAWDALFEGCFVDDGYTLTVVRMTDEEFSKLPEFMGF